MTPALIRIVKAASLVPSGDNCQPWRFRWDGSNLLISHQEERARHALNRTHHASLLSLGCVIESLSIAATAEDLKVSCSFLEDRLIQDPGAKLHFEPSQGPPDPLHTALSIRATDRRLYHGGVLTDELQRGLSDDAKSFKEASLYFQSHYPDELLRYLMQIECLVWEDKKVHQDLFHWIRFSRREAEATRDGMPWRNLGVSFAESRLLKLCRNYSFQKLMNRVMFVKKIRSHTLCLVRSSGALGIITVKSKSPKDLVEAGRFWLRAWCRLNQNGWGLQPMSIGALPVYDEACGCLPSDIFPRYHKLIQQGREILQKAFHFPENEIPVMLFRTGKSSPLREEARTLRLHLEEILEFS